MGHLSQALRNRTVVQVRPQLLLQLLPQQLLLLLLLLLWRQAAAAAAAACSLWLVTVTAAGPLK